MTSEYRQCLYLGFLNMYDANDERERREQSFFFSQEVVREKIHSWSPRSAPSVGAVRFLKQN